MFFLTPSMPARRGKMIGKLISRNMKLYFRDRMAVFFSLLSVLIVIALYVLFLALLQVDDVNEKLGGSVSEDAISYLINSWILAGLLSITCVTSTLGAFGSFVNDREKKIIMDFKSAPISYGAYPVASAASSFVVGTVISILTFIIYTIYIYMDTGYVFSREEMIKCLGMILFSVLMSSALMGFMVTFFSTSSAFSSASLIIGTVIGFLNAVYVPMGSLPNQVQTVLNCLPFGHIASLFRRVLMVDSIDTCFEGAPGSVIEDYKETYAVELSWGGSDIEVSTSLIFIGAVFIAALLLMFFNYSRKRDEI